MYKMILADDNALSIKGLEANLDFAAMGVELAGSFLSGMDVLAYLTQHPDVDLLVSDIRMPHMTGLELAREALSRNKMIKIVLISAYDDFEYAQEALRIGVTDYVQKPIQYDELTATLRRALKKLEEERAVLRRLEAAQPELRKKFYQDLIRIHPMLVAQTLAQEAQYLGIATEGGSFLSVAVAAEENEDRLTLPDAEASLLNYFIKTDAVQAWFGSELDCRVIGDREELLLVLHDPQGDVCGILEKVRTLCERFGTAHPGLDLNLCFGIGTSQTTLWGIPLSLEAAHRAVNRRFVYPDQVVFTEGNEATGLLPFLTHIAEAQDELVQLLLRRDTAALDTMEAHLTESVIAQLKEPSLIVPYLVVLVSGVLGQVRQDGVDLSEAEGVITGFSARCRHPVSIRDIQEMLNQFFRHTMAALAQSQQSYQHKLLGKAKEYIENNLSDSQLRLENIATEVHVTPSHLSRIFKRSEGINVSDYITQKRIERATRLLRSTSEPISFVSDQVGYASPYYFSACFKKITGLTPSEYRRGRPESMK